MGSVGWTACMRSCPGAMGCWKRARAAQVCPQRLWLLLPVWDTLGGRQVSLASTRGVIILPGRSHNLIWRGQDKFIINERLYRYQCLRCQPER